MILVLGGTGMLGSAVTRKLKSIYDPNSIISIGSVYDLTDTATTNALINSRNISTIFHCAGLVGGIMQNKNNQYDFIMKNSQMAINTINAAVKYDIKNFYYISSSCVYPAECFQPMREVYLMSGMPEITNRGYAMAKLLGMEACKFAKEKTGNNFVSLIPCNLYGPQDNFTESGHVLASLVRKICSAVIEDKGSVSIWGDGTARREFLHVDDCADAIIACHDAIEAKNGICNIDNINIGAGIDYSISEIAKMIAYTAGWEGEFIYDDTKPTGMKKKLLCSSHINSIGWTPSIPLYQGIDEMIMEYYDAVKI